MSASKSGYKCPYCYKTFSSRESHKSCKKRDKAETSPNGEDQTAVHSIVSKGANSCNPIPHDECTGSKTSDEEEPSTSGCTSAQTRSPNGKVQMTVSLSKNISESYTSEDVKISSAKDQKGQKTQFRRKKVLYENDEQKMKKFTDRLFERKIIEKSRNTKTDILKFFGEEVKLRRQQMEKASDFFNPLVKNVHEKLEKETKWKWRILKSGSFYDGTKVSRPDEMDCMFVAVLRNLKMCTAIDSKFAPPGFCYLKLLKSREDLQTLCEGDFLSSTKFRQHVFGCLQSLPESNRRISRDTTLSEGSPSFGVNYDTGLKNEDGSKFIISMDLVPALHFSGWPDTGRDFSKKKMERLRKISENGFHVVAKSYDGEDSDLLWRLSFSKAEKILTKFADSPTVEAESEDEEERRKDRSVKGRGKDSPLSGKGEGDEKEVKGQNYQEKHEELSGDGDGPGSEKGDTTTGTRKGGPGKEGIEVGKGKDEVEKGKTCRKKVFRIVKRMLEILKDKEEDSTVATNAKCREVSTALRRAAQYVREQGYSVDKHRFTTFQLRTLMWNVFYETTLEDHVWKAGDVVRRVDDIFWKLKKMLTGEMHVEHFFIRGLDIMADVSVAERKYLYIMVCVVERYL